jgi:hypothetical protein
MNKNKKLSNGFRMLSHKTDILPTTNNKKKHYFGVVYLEASLVRCLPHVIRPRPTASVEVPAGAPPS